MSGRLYEETAWNIARLLAWWRDSASDASEENVRLHAATRESQRERAQVDLEELTRQEEIKLVQRVFLTPGLKRRIVLFAGVERDNGCARVCIRAGQTLARLTAQSVCVVDANVHSPSLHRLAGIDTCDGLAAAAERPAAASTFAVQMAPDRLWLLPSGPASDRAPLLTVERVQPCLEELGAHFDHIIINTPPMNLYAESLALSQFTDGVLLILEANVTRRETVRNMKNRLEDLGVPLLGVVLNNRTFPIPETLYRLL